MTITHHLNSATIVGFSSGTLPYGIALVVEAHLEMCPTCRLAARVANEVGGCLLADESSTEVAPDSKSSVMKNIQTATLHRLPISRAVTEEVPRALKAALGTGDLDSLKWQKAGLGVAMYKLPDHKEDPGFLGLLRIAPGCTLPDHGHGGTELTLILRGSYHDEIGQFARGDVADLDESISHTPVVPKNEECICLVANDAPTRFRSWPARVVQRFIGI